MKGDDGKILLPNMLLNTVQADVLCRPKTVNGASRRLNDILAPSTAGIRILPITNELTLTLQENTADMTRGVSNVFGHLGSALSS